MTARGEAVVDFVRTEVDGVPTFWIPAEGRMRAGLVFRVGRADETLARSGGTHLIEHLALHNVDDAASHVNGMTAPTVTMFVTQAEPDQVVRFLADVCSGLRDLPLDRLDAERKLLRTEAAGRSAAPNESLLVWRYGAASYGLPGFPEFGLNDLTGEDLRAWVARWFTRGNAALWLAGGPPPPGLRLDLPDGQRMPPPTPTSALPETPAYFNHDARMIGFDAVVPRSTAATLYTAVLTRRMHAALRRELGVSYQTQASYDPRDGAYATVTAVADSLPDSRAQATDRFVDVLIDLAGDGVTEAELLTARIRAIQSLDEPAALPARVASVAMNLLLGAPVHTVDQVREQVESVTLDAIASVGRAVIRTGLMMLPPDRQVGRAGFVAAPQHSEAAVSGVRISTRDAGRNRDVLVLGAEGASIIAGREPGHPALDVPSRVPERIATVSYRDCQAMLAWPDGARTLIGTDAITVRVEPTLWEITDADLARLDRAIPAERVVHMPAREPGAILRPRTAPDAGPAGAPAAMGTAGGPVATGTGAGRAERLRRRLGRMVNVRRWSRRRRYIALVAAMVAFSVAVLTWSGMPFSVIGFLYTPLILITLVRVPQIWRYRAAARQSRALVAAHPPAGPIVPAPTVDQSMGDPVLATYRRSLAEADWPAVAAALAAATGDDERALLLDLLGPTRAAEIWLRDAVRDQPDATLPLLAYGSRMTAWAWEARSRAQARYVTREQFALFHQRLRVAEDCLQSVVRREPDNVGAWYKMITVARGLQLGEDESRRRFEQVTRRSPYHVRAHAQRMQQVCRKWGGSYEAMHAFAQRAMLGAPAGSPLGYLVAVAYLEEWLDRDRLPVVLKSDDAVDALVEAAQRSVNHSEYRRGRDWPLMDNTFAMAFSLAGRYDLAAPMFQRLGDLVTDSPWEYARGGTAAFIEHRDRALRAVTGDRALRAVTGGRALRAVTGGRARP